MHKENLCKFQFNVKNASKRVCNMQSASKAGHRQPVALPQETHTKKTQAPTSKHKRKMRTFTTVLFFLTSREKIHTRTYTHNYCTSA